jgi:predicted CXXCH cytochrome family protein
MRARWVAAAACAALAGAGGAGEGGDARCELSRLDRARTPSTACMQCHEGTAGAAVPSRMTVRGDGSSHRVGVEYAAAAARAPERYAPASALPPDVPLVAGRIECTTCHDGALATPHQVVAQPRLCLACHRL